MSISLEMSISLSLTILISVWFEMPMLEQVKRELSVFVLNEGTMWK